MKPQTIQIFLPEGSPTSVKEAELSNLLIKTIIKQNAKILTILLGILLACHASAKQDNTTDNSEWFVPEGVVYVPGDEKAVEEVRSELLKTFTDHKKKLYKLAKKQSGYFFLGPLLSARIRDENPIKASELRTAGFWIKILEDFEPEIKGLLAKTNEEKKLLSQLLSDRIGDSKKILLRKLHPDELAFMWYFISWDIKEPVFVLETDDHTFLIDFGAMSENQLWVEEISDPCYQFGFEEIMSPCLCFEVQMEAKKWSAGFLEKPKECTVNTIQTNSVSQQDPDEIQNLAVSLEAVLFIDDEYVIGANMATEVMASWIKMVELELNESVLPGQEGKIAIKVTAQVTGHPEFEIKYQNEIKEDWLLLLDRQLATVENINAKHQAVNFELVFVVNSTED